MQHIIYSDQTSICAKAAFNTFDDERLLEPINVQKLSCTFSSTSVLMRYSKT